MIVTLKDITTKITKGTTPTSIGCKFEKSGINFIKSESLSMGKRLIKVNLPLSRSGHTKG